MTEKPALTLKDYADRALSWAVYPNLGDNLPYPTLGLSGETGEAVEKMLLGLGLTVAVGKASELVKKRERDSNSEFSPEKRLLFLKELGDVLWYIAACAKEAGSSLEEVAEIALKKLEDRAARGTLHGEGDNR